MNYCLFQGTFNPIHNAHLRIAQYVLSYFGADKILFIPAFIPPHKNSEQEMAKHRYKMVSMAIKDNPKFDISDIEYKRGGTSFTYLTVRELYNKLKPAGKIKFIIGSDAFKGIENWYESDKLKNLIDFIVFIRENNFSADELDSIKRKGYNFELMPLEFEDISSTDIRNRINTGSSIKNLVPKCVEEYIIKNELYKL